MNNCFIVLFAGMFSGATTLVFEASAIDLRPPKFGDSNRVPFAGGSPGIYPIHGVDVARYQGDIDWKKLKSGGISFAFIKATEGRDYIDPTFKEYWNGAKRAGIPRGAYHFYYFCKSARSQAAWFIRNVPKDPTALPPILDAEWNPRSKTCRKKPSPSRVRSEFHLFLKLLERYYGKKPIIYTAPDFYEDNFKGAFRNYNFWLRTVVAHPRVKYPRRRWMFWQYTGTGRMNGVEGNIDINVYNGSAGSFYRWLRKVTTLK